MLGLLEVFALNLFHNINLDQRIVAFAIVAGFIINNFTIPPLEDLFIRAFQEDITNIAGQFLRVLEVLNDVTALSIERDTCIAPSETEWVFMNETNYCGRLNPAGLFSTEFHSKLAAKNETISRVLDKIEVEFSKPPFSYLNVKYILASYIIVQVCHMLSPKVEEIVHEMSSQFTNSYFCVHVNDDRFYFNQNM